MSRLPDWVDETIDEHCVKEAIGDACDEGGYSVDSFLWNLDKQGYKIVPLEGDRGDGRMVHYGSGKQPWDTCLELGWAAYGAAFSILRYLRRTKTPERDLKHAKIYLGWLKELASKNSRDLLIHDTLMLELTEAEKERLNG